MGQEKLSKAAIAVTGGVPATWSDAMMNDVAAVLDGLQPVSPGRPMPYSTFLIWVFNERGPKALEYQNPMLGGEAVERFESKYPQWKEEAEVRAKVDFSNAAKELEAFNDVQACIRSPHLSLSSLFRYLLCQKLSFQALLDTEMTGKAKYDLRKNPWLYAAYGEQLETLMPLKWEDI